jgi:hypothetical protein
METLKGHGHDFAEKMTLRHVPSKGQQAANWTVVPPPLPSLRPAVPEEEENWTGLLAVSPLFAQTTMRRPTAQQDRDVFQTGRDGPRVRSTFRPSHPNHTLNTL